MSAEKDEEAVGLVDEAYIPQVPTSLISAKCQFVLVLSTFSLFMLLVGFLVGRDSARQIDASIENKHPPYKTPPPVPTSTLPPLDGQNEIPTLQPTLTRLPFDIEDFKSAKELAEKSLQFLIDYYGSFADSVLLGNVGFGFGFTGPNRGPTNPISFQRTVDVIARSIVHKDPLKLGFIGSSVMCGHDNCYYDSFPAQMDRYLQSIFTKVGAPLVFRNACQGGGCGDSFHNQIFCTRHMVGDDIDFLFYEWTYFETGGDVPMYHDLIAHWVGLFPKSPPLIIFNADNDAWHGYELMKKYERFGANAFNLEQGLRSGNVYPGKEWGVSGDKMHETCRYGENESDERKKSLGVVFRNWHPGPLGFQYISDLASYLFLRALVAAIDQVLENPHKAVEKWPMNPEPIEPLPQPSFSEKGNELLYQLAKLDEEAPGCLTVQASAFGRAIISVADNSKDSLNPYRDHVKKIDSGRDAWSLWSAGANWGLVPRAERAKLGDKCLPPDHCAYFRNPQNLEAETPLVFRLPKMTIGMIVICGGDINAGTNWKKSRDDFTAAFDGKTLNPDDFIVFPSSKCLCLQSKFNGPVEDKNGHLYLSIVAHKDMAISQVITA